MSSCPARVWRPEAHSDPARSNASLLRQSGIVAPSFVGGRDHAQLHRELAEVPVRAAADDLPVLVHLGGGAPGDGGLACGGDAEEILVKIGRASCRDRVCQYV